jgi:predicted transcriptional regulator
VGRRDFKDDPSSRPSVLRGRICGMNEAERIRRFETAYNRIDHALADLIGNSTNRRKNSFATKVRIAAARQRRIARHADFLAEIGDLRNALVHSRTDEEHYIAVPSEQTVLELEQIEKNLFSPDRVIPRFERKVQTLSGDQTMADLLGLMRDDGYSRYPVYDKEGFVGLLTTNGIARWAAGSVKGNRLEIDLSQVKVSDVLAEDHRRDRVAFVSRDAFIDDVDDLFSREKHIEAVIITPSGKPHEKPIGMICAPDIASRGKS